MSVFTKNAGRFLNKKETVSLTSSYRQRKLDVGLSADEFTRSEFFGLDHVMRLLSQPGCVGLRVHHAKRWEDENGRPTQEGEGQLKPRVLLTGVDAAGRDMLITSDKTGLKDMPGDDGDQTLGDGHTCPQHCGA